MGNITSLRAFYIMIFIKPKRKYWNARGGGIRRPSGGFTILYAILLTTVVLTIGLSLLSVLIQQISLSGAQRESGASFYVSDSGMECALYWDISADAFRSGSAITCDGNSPLAPGIIVTTGIPLTPPSPPLANDTYVFNVLFPDGCANISVIKTINTASSTVASTTIQSRGYNTNCPPAASIKPWRLERGLETNY